MTLVDTSVWIDHFRRRNIGLIELLERDGVLMHPFVVGELALGNFSPRATVVSARRDLPRPVVASHEEVLGFIETERLFGIGIGYTDAHLLAAVRRKALRFQPYASTSCLGHFKAFQTMVSVSTASTTPSIL